MAETAIALLPDRGVVSVTGADAAKLLQGVITNDMDHIAGAGRAQPGCCRRRVKSCSTSSSCHSPDGFCLETARDKAAELAKRLTMYRLRADVEIEDVSRRLYRGSDLGRGDTPRAAMARATVVCRSALAGPGHRGTCDAALRLGARRRGCGQRHAGRLPRPSHRAGRAGRRQGLCLRRHVSARGAVRSAARGVVREGLLRRPGDRLAHAAPRHGAASASCRSSGRGALAGRAARAIIAGDVAIGTLGSVAGSARAWPVRLDRAAEFKAKGDRLARRRCRRAHRDPGVRALLARAQAARCRPHEQERATKACSAAPGPATDAALSALSRRGVGRAAKTAIALFEKLVLEGFQAGLSWITILRKRENFRQRFDDFDAETIAATRSKDVARLMADAGIVRNRLKIEATIDNAKAYLKLRERTTPGRFLWDFLDKDGPVQNRARAMGDIPAETELSKRISKALKAEGFRFVGPTTCMPSCSRRAWSTIISSAASGTPSAPSCSSEARSGDALTTKQLAAGARLAAHAVGPPARSARPSPADIEIEDIAHGLARVARWNGQTVGAHAFSVAQHALIVEEIARRLQPGLAGALAAGGAAARCARVRRRRPHQPVQDRHRPRLQSLRVASARRDPQPLRTAGAAAERCSAARSSAPIASPPSSRRRGLAGFCDEEATIFRPAERLAAD